MAQHYGQTVDDEQLEGPNVLEQRVFGTELHVYGGRSGYVCELTSSWHPQVDLELPCACLGAVSTCTFWRFMIQIPLSDSEMKIQYSINDGLDMDFFVPARTQPMRVAAYSVRDPNRHCSVLS